MEKEFFSQQELSERWCCSMTKIKTARRQGLIPYFQLPASNRYVYPVKGIVEYEQSKIKGGDKISKLLSVPSPNKWRAS